MLKEGFFTASSFLLRFSAASSRQVTVTFVIDSRMLRQLSAIFSRYADRFH